MGRFDLVIKRELWVRRKQRLTRCRLMVAAFCEQEHVSIAALYQWRKKLLTNDDSDAGTSAMPDSLMTRPRPIKKRSHPEHVQACRQDERQEESDRRVLNRVQTH